jgi:hypothetical protein
LTNGGTLEDEEESIGHAHLCPMKSLPSNKANGFILPRDITWPFLEQAFMWETRDTVVGIRECFVDIVFLGELDGPHDCIGSISIPSFAKGRRG